MKKLILLILLLPFMATAQINYYISPTGSNTTGNGSLSNPWFEIGYASSQMSAGDTLFCRGGTYYYDETQEVGGTGTYGNEIVFINYPNETPIFDFWNFDVSDKPAGSNDVALRIRGDYSYLKFVGLHVRKFWKINTDNGRAMGWTVDGGAHHITYDRCKVDSIAGYGFAAFGRDVFYYNCDAWGCADPQLADPGNGGMGFMNHGYFNEAMQDTVLYYNCRSWLNSDQGFGASGGLYTIYDGCWSFNNGIHPTYSSGGGHGFKYGLIPLDIDSIGTKLINNIAVYNYQMGFHENITGPKMNIRMYNNLSAHNGGNGFFSGYEYTSNLDNKAVYRNNISFGSKRLSETGYDFWDYNGLTAYGADHSYNTWDEPYHETTQTRHFDSPATVNDDDFIAVPDSTTNLAIMSSPRQSDGSLPDLGDYWKLAPTSDLIDAGIDVGLPYEGTAPDLGPFEYIASLINLTGYETTTVTPLYGNIPTDSLINSYNSYWDSLYTNLTILKTGIETFTATTITWNTDTIVPITYSMRGSVIRNTINNNNIILFDNMTNVLNNALTILEVASITGYDETFRYSVISPSPRQFIEIYNQNFEVLNNNINLLYTNLSSYGN